MIQQWWSISSDDSDRVMIQIEWWSRSSDDLDPVMMIQQWWSRSSDDPDPMMMIQIQWWWSRLSDDPDPVMMIQIKWWSRWRWRGLDDDPDDTEKKTCADKLCRENTFLVKRECWCNCNFGMYSLVFLIYCNPMFIPGFYYVMSCPDVLIRKIYNVNKSCQVIVGNPPIV